MDKIEERNHKNSKVIENQIFEDKKLKNKCLDDFVNCMSLEDRISQMFIENLQGNKSFVPVEKKSELSNKSDDLKALIPGGYLFFGFNLSDSEEEIMYFTDSIRDFCVKNDIIPPYLALDQEGGFVNRLKTINGPLPSSQRVSETLFIKDAYILYSLQAKQMHALGFDINLAPVTEICTIENKDFLNERSFGNAEDVFIFSRCFINAFQNNKVQTILKHFPGNTNTDPHTGLPEITLSYEELDQLLIPFKKLIKYEPSGVLMSHARTSCISPGVPGCLSSEWVTTKLKKEYKFNGLVFSDDIFMGALNDNGYPPEDAVILAIDAGIDVIMLSEKRFASSARIVLKNAKQNALFEQKINNSVKKILKFKIKQGLLKYEEAKTADGQKKYNLKPFNPYEKMEDRLVSFRDAREKNINLYLEKF